MAGVDRRRFLSLAVLVSLSQLACGQTKPIEPSGPSFDVVCPATLLVGLTGYCFALVRGTQQALDATWTSSDPSVASFGPLAGSLKGRSAGQVVATATYQGKSESVSVSVLAEDVLQVSASTFQGTFQAGNSVMMGVVGAYGVASAESGQLNLVIRDQNDAVVSMSPPQLVPNGGDTFVIHLPFVIPAGTTRLCRSAVLQIGAVTLTAAGPPETHPCVDVAQ